MSLHRVFWYLTLATSLFLCMAGCRRHQEEKPRVDVKGTASAIEKKLLQLAESIQKGQPDEAQRHYGEAQELLEKYRAELRGHPKFAALVDRMNAAPAELCMGFVSKAVVDFQAAVQTKDPEASKETLDRMNQEHARCAGQLQARKDYGELKMKVEAGPQALADLEKVLEAESKVKRMNNEIADYENRLATLSKDVSDPESPEPGWLAEEILKRSGELKSAVEERIEWKDKPEWDALIKKTHEELGRVEQKRQPLLVQGKAVQAIEGAKRAASDAEKARSTEEPKEQETLLVSALDGFKRCQSTLSALVKADRRLAGYVRPFEDNNRSVSWLTTHCGQRGQEMKKLLRENKRAQWLKKTPARSERKLAKAKKKPSPPAPKPRNRK